MYYFFLIALVTVLTVNVINVEAHVRSKRIVGGDVISNSKVPWLVMLVRNEKQFCSGALISKNALMTSASCIFYVNASDLIIVFGASRKDEIKVENIHLVKTITSHPKYEIGEMQNDIAIVVLKRNVNENEYSPIKLPPPRMSTYKHGCVAGWGYTILYGPSSNELREVCFTENDFTDCSNHVMADTKTHICVGSRGKDRCYYDNGGPLYTEVDGNETAIGIVSYGRSCGRTDSVYTRVSEHVQWIRNTIDALELSSYQNN